MTTCAVATDEELQELLRVTPQQVKSSPRTIKLPAAKRDVKIPAPVDVPKTQYSVVDFDTPRDVLTLLREHMTAHQWQEEELDILGGYFDGIPGPRYRPSDKHPFYYNLVAANGSGKDACIIVPFAVWFCVSKLGSRCIITSSSYEQLKHQTFKYLKAMCEKLNQVMNEKIFDIVEFHIRCLRTGSEIKLHVTDEAGKAEGFHPDPDFPNAELAFIANEARSIIEPLWTGFARYTGYNYWIEVSAPGGKAGHFFKTSTALNVIRSPEAPKLGRRRVRHVTAFECPHIAEAHIVNMIEELGENCPIVRNSIFAEFASIDESMVINEVDYDKCKNNPPVESGEDIGIGLDCAAGGDEMACYVRKGNRIIYKFQFRQPDTELASDIVDKQLEPWKLGAYEFNVDNGGIGTGYVSGLQKRGWKVTRRNNNSTPYQKGIFGNLGAEMYFKIKRFIETRVIRVLDATEDSKLRTQLTTRKFLGFDRTQGKMSLQPKKEALASGLPSPDRADAFVLCFYSYKPVKVKEAVRKNLGTIEQWIEQFEEGRIMHRSERHKPPPPNHAPTIISMAI